MDLSKLQAKYSQFEQKSRNWLSKQPVAVEAGCVGTLSALQGAAIGAMFGVLGGDVNSMVPQGTVLPPETARQMRMVAAGPAIQARNLAVISGVNRGLTVILRRARNGVEDLPTVMTAAFGSGVAYGFLVHSPEDAAPLRFALQTGAGFAAIQGGLTKLGNWWAAEHAEPAVDPYMNTKGMLSTLGLQKYAKNFKKGQLTDPTLPLLTERALSDVHIPPGPRLLILDHIHGSKK